MPILGAIRYLFQLGDVLLTALADGEVLTYEAASQRWKNKSVSAYYRQLYAILVIPYTTNAMGGGNGDRYTRMNPIQIPVTLTVDRIGWINGAVSAGNFRAGIYNDNGGIPDGGTLVVQSASVATTGVSRTQEVTIADTQLAKGLYWLCLHNSTTTDTVRTVLEETFGGTLQTRGFAQPYGALPTPCPVTVVRVGPIIYLRVKSVP